MVCVIPCPFTLLWLAILEVDTPLLLIVRICLCSSLCLKIIVILFYYLGWYFSWLSHVGSRHRWTVPFSLGTITKLHHLAVSPNPSGTIVCCSCNLFNSFLNGSCSTYAMHLGGTWCGLTPLTCNKNVPLEHLIPVNTSLYSLCNS